MNSKQLAMSVLLAGMGQSAAFAQTTLPATATVHFYQGKAVGLFFLKYRVYANDKLVCKLGRNSHCQVVLPAGATVFVANTRLTKSPILTLGSVPKLDLVLEAGKSYYLQGDMAAAGARMAGVSYGFTEVVPNASKLVQIDQSKAVPPLVSAL